MAQKDKTPPQLPKPEMNHLKPTVFSSTMLKTGIVASLALLTAACSTDQASTTDPLTNGAPTGIVAGTLEVTAANGVVTLRNTTEQLVNYLLLDKNMAVVAIYPLCGAANCSTLIQGASASVQYSQIPGYNSQSKEAIVYWGRYIIRPDGTKVLTGVEQATTIKLK